MDFHKYKIGQRVTFRPSRSDSPSTYTVTALLPARGGEFKYRIRRQGALMDLVAGKGEPRQNNER
jgi:hypothetical protein